MDEERSTALAPRAVRPLYSEYLTVAAVIKLERNIYDMTPMEFQTACMIHSNGYMHPKRALEIYYALMEEAGL
jgi:hypothetical protein